MSKKYKFKKHQETQTESDLFLHKHCTVCDKIISPDEEYCSEECKNHVASKKKSQKKKNYLNYGVIIFIVVIFIVIIFVS